MEMNLLTIREYAKQKNVTYEAVRKQIQKYKDNELKDHIIRKNKTQYLDKYAIDFLDNRRRESPVMLYQMNQDEEIQRLTEENKKLLLKLTEVQEALIKAKEQTLLAEQQKLLLEDKERQLQAKDEELSQLQNKTKKLEENCSYYEQVAEEQAKSLDEAKQLENDMTTELEEIKQMNVWQFIKYRKKGNT